MQARPPVEDPAAGPPPGDPAGEPVFCFELGCPECGAPCAFGEEDVTTTCDYCDSRLILTTEGQEPRFYLPRALTSPPDVERAVVQHRTMRAMPSIRALFRNPEGGVPVPEWVIEAEIRRAEEGFRAQVRIDELQWLHAPYWVSVGELAQAFVGRDRTGVKRVSFRCFVLETICRGYDASRVNLRDRGLRVAAERPRLLTTSVVTGLPGHFLRPVEESSTVRAQARALGPHNQDRTLTPTGAPRSHLCFERTLLVYKPLVMVRYAIDRGEELLLLDAMTGIAAGELSQAEWSGWVSGEDFAPPVLSRNEDLVHVLASECPVCGNEQNLDRRARLELCTVCNRALRVDSDGIRDLAYSWGEAGDGLGEESIWLPFWRFPFQLVAADGSIYRSLGELHRAIWAGLPLQADADDHLFLPAVRCLGHARLDAAWEAMARALTYHPPELRPGPFPPDTPGRRVSATLAADDARGLAPLVLYALLDKPRRARINMPTVKRLLAESRLELGEARLAVVRVPLARNRLLLAGESVDLGLVTREGAARHLREAIGPGLD